MKKAIALLMAVVLTVCFMAVPAFADTWEIGPKPLSNNSDHAMLGVLTVGFNYVRASTEVSHSGYSVEVELTVDAMIYSNHEEVYNDWSIGTMSTNVECNYSNILYNGYQLETEHWTRCNNSQVCYETMNKYNHGSGWGDT